VCDLWPCTPAPLILVKELSAKITKVRELEYWMVLKTSCVYLHYSSWLHNFFQDWEAKLVDERLAIGYFVLTKEMLVVHLGIKKLRILICQYHLIFYSPCYVIFGSATQGGLPTKFRHVSRVWFSMPWWPHFWSWDRPRLPILPLQVFQPRLNLSTTEVSNCAAMPD